MATYPPPQEAWGSPISPYPPEMAFQQPSFEGPVRVPRFRTHASTIAEVLAIIALIVTIPIALIMIFAGMFLSALMTFFGLPVYLTFLALIPGAVALVIVIVFYVLVYRSILDCRFNVAKTTSLALFVVSLVIMIVGLLILVGVLMLVPTMFLYFLWRRCAEAEDELAAARAGVVAGPPVYEPEDLSAPGWDQQGSA